MKLIDSYESSQGSSTEQPEEISGFQLLDPVTHFSKVPIILLGTLRCKDGDSIKNIAIKVNLCFFNLSRNYSTSLTL